MANFTLISFVIALLCLVIRSSMASVPAVYIFGDSTADVGNNNFLPKSLAKANFPPNGIDFVYHRATGRFSNGLNSADFLAKLLGFQRSPPPFLSLTNRTLPKQAPKGVNFASAGSGIFEGTGTKFGDRVPVWNQLDNFDTVRSSLIDCLGMVQTEALLSKSIFFISVGSNDLIDFFSAQGRVVSLPEQGAYIKSLVSAYEFQIRRLYELGARKIGVISAPPVGCCPSQRIFNATGGCLEGLNDLALMFYDATSVMLKDLSYDLKELNYSLGNLFGMVTNFFQNAAALGFTELESACCGGGRFNGEMPCTPNSTFCNNRNAFLFWDSFHPSQAASKVAAQTLFSGPLQFVSPINFGQLAADDY